MKDEVDGWCFTYEETSMGVYRVTGMDRQGHRVSRQGSDLEQLLAECRQDAWDMVRYIAEKDQSERA